MFAVACGGGSSDPVDATPIDARLPKDAAPPDAPLPTFGGARPSVLLVPPSYDPQKPIPLVIALHGYFPEPNYIVPLFGLETFARDHGVLLTAPDGTKDIDEKGSYFWNATDACCDFSDKKPDDVAYLTGLIQEIQAAYNVDPKRIYVIGHSNGSFMALRLACEKSDLIAAVISVAGAATANVDECKPGAPVSVLHIHSDTDDTIKYAGGTITQRNGDVAAYPSAASTIATWAKLDTCSTDTVTDTPIDAEQNVKGEETTRLRYTGCPAGIDAELWTIVGGPHAPIFQTTVHDLWWTWLDAHAKR